MFYWDSQMEKPLFPGDSPTWSRQFFQQLFTLVQYQIIKKNDMLLGKPFISLNSIHNLFPKANKVLLDFAHLLFWKVICCEQASNKANVDFKHWHLWILWKYIENIHIHMKLYTFQNVFNISHASCKHRGECFSHVLHPHFSCNCNLTSHVLMLLKLLHYRQRSFLSRIMAISCILHMWNCHDVWHRWLFSPPESLTSRILPTGPFPCSNRYSTMSIFTCHSPHEF